MTDLDPWNIRNTLSRCSHSRLGVWREAVEVHTEAIEEHDYILHMHELNCISTMAGGSTVTASIPAASSTVMITGEAQSGTETNEGLRPRPMVGMEDRLDAGSHCPGTQVRGQDQSEQVPSSISWMTVATCQTQVDKRAGISQTAEWPFSRLHEQQTDL